MYDNTSTIEFRTVMCYVFKEYITLGASVYMWNEGSHSSDIRILIHTNVGMGKGRARLSSLGGGGDS